MYCNYVSKFVFFFFFFFLNLILLNLFSKKIEKKKKKSKQTLAGIGIQLEFYQTHKQARIGLQCQQSMAHGQHYLFLFVLICSHKR